jgi:hypothetical protein
VQRNGGEPLGTFQVGFGVVLADTYSGAQGERLFSRAPDVNLIVSIVGTLKFCDYFMWDQTEEEKYFLFFCYWLKSKATLSCPQSSKGVKL